MAALRTIVIDERERRLMAEQLLGPFDIIREDEEMRFAHLIGKLLHGARVVVPGQDAQFGGHSVGIVAVANVDSHGFGLPDPRGEFRVSSRRTVSSISRK